jgi:hypothetical protein
MSENQKYPSSENRKEKNKKILLYLILYTYTETGLPTLKGIRMYVEVS